MSRQLEASRDTFLQAFALKTDFVPDSEQARVLDKLRSVVMWSGRYPVALKIAGHRNVYAGRQDTIDASTDISAICELYKTLTEALERKVGHDMPPHDVIINVGDGRYMSVDT